MLVCMARVLRALRGNTADFQGVVEQQQLRRLYVCSCRSRRRTLGLSGRGTVRAIRVPACSHIQQPSLLLQEAGQTAHGAQVSRKGGAPRLQQLPVSSSHTAQRVRKYPRTLHSSNDKSLLEEPDSVP